MSKYLYIKILNSTWNIWKSLFKLYYVDSSFKWQSILMLNCCCNNVSLHKRYLFSAATAALYARTSKNSQIWLRATRFPQCVNKTRLYFIAESVINLSVRMPSRRDILSNRRCFTTFRRGIKSRRVVYQIEHNKKIIRAVDSSISLRAVRVKLTG